MTGKQLKRGAIWARALEPSVAENTSAAPEKNAQAVDRSSTETQRFAFIGLCLFTLLLYLRPNDWLPGVLGSIPLAKMIAIPTLIAYAGTRLSSGQPLTKWPLEMKMLMLIVILGIGLIPVAVARERSINMLTDTFFKVVTVFVLMINVIDTRARLRTIMRIVVICGAVISVLTIRDFLLGRLDTSHALSAGVSDINPNELAMVLDLLLPFGVVLALSAKGLARLCYLCAAALQTVAVVLTFSRGGFLGLAALAGVLLWKAGRGKRLATIGAAVLLTGVFLVSVPGGYSDRLFTIVHIEEDRTNSAQQRRDLLMRAIDVAAAHPIIGIGIGNYPEYSFQAKVAHNSYVEIAAELGLAGLAAYLTFVLGPFRSLRRIDREAFGSMKAPGEAGQQSREDYFMSVGLQAALIAYLVCSFFSSSEYFWHLYYVVAYAVSLRSIALRTNPSPRVVPNAGAASGIIWKGRNA